MKMGGRVETRCTRQLLLQLYDEQLHDEQLHDELVYSHQQHHHHQLTVLFSQNSGSH